ncbi:glycosyltransferase 61 family protein [Aliiroseovarius sp. F47248L]|uniref:glycosyltransferase family 61 protein n=1 Tax=Aliiroseovarius sp. F47248L TaxID=2926420 RepID=UPI001FF4D84B|nr:glycosyltransferase 61 family protein [Aliiroseovarius sp. F47248L]MCK0139065.1 glycosyltransferase family 61 protein [Aliiroseovarius sp. F47248L]
MTLGLWDDSEQYLIIHSKEMKNSITPDASLSPILEGLTDKLIAGNKIGGNCAQDIVEPVRETPIGLVGDVRLNWAKNAIWHVQSGRMVLEDGRVPASLSGLRDIQKPGKILKVRKGALWLCPASEKNYGHFIFDALTGLNFLSESGLDKSFHPIAAGLNSWQHELVETAGLTSNAYEKTVSEVHFEEVIWLTSMNHYLHRNDGLFRSLAMKFERPKSLGADAVYFSRRGYYGRVLVNEQKLETELSNRGVRVLRPQKMSVREQIDAMRTARVLIGSTGAALANICFLAPQAKVIELRPPRMEGPWLDMAAANLDINLKVIPSLAATNVPAWVRFAQLPRKLLRRYHFSYEIDIPTVLQEL